MGYHRLRRYLFVPTMMEDAFLAEVLALEQTLLLARDNGGRTVDIWTDSLELIKWCSLDISLCFYYWTCECVLLRLSSY